MPEVPVAHLSEQARITRFGSFSRQAGEITKQISQGRDVAWDRYAQVTDRSKEFLRGVLQGGHVPSGEETYVTSSMLTASTPARQDQILDATRPFLSNGEGEVQTQRENIQRRLILDYAIEKANPWQILSFYGENPFVTGHEKKVDEAIATARRLQLWTPLLHFLEHPVNQKGREQLVEEVLNKATRKKEFPEDTLYFFMNPQNTKGRETLVEELLRKAQKTSRWALVLEFLENPENQRGREKLIERAIAKVGSWHNENGDWRGLFTFFRTAENQVGREQYVGSFLAIATRQKQWDLLATFFQNPKNQEKYTEIFERLNEHLGEVSDSILMDFLKTAENQTGRGELIDKNLKSFLHKREGSPLVFFQDNKNVPVLGEFNDVAARIVQGIGRIADERLREEYYQVAYKYIENKNPLSLISVESLDDSPLLMAGSLLGLDPRVVKSWNLSDQQQSSLLPIFLRIGSQAQDVFKDVVFPFAPRLEVKEARDIAPRVLEWFQFVDLLFTLPPQLGGMAILRQHLTTQKTIQERYGVTKITLNPPIAMMKDTIRDYHAARKEALRRFLGMFGLQERGITYEQFQEFVSSWNGEIESLTKLAGHYGSMYPEGLRLLSGIVESNIKGTYEQSRYDLGQPLVRTQLAPLLDRVPVEKWKEVIGIWREKHPVFIVSAESQKGKTGFDVEKTRTYLQENLTNKGHNHLEALFDLDVLRELPVEKRELLVSKLVHYLGGNKETLHLGQFMQDLKGILPAEKASLLLGISQFFKDMFYTKKSQQELLVSLNKLLGNIQKNWPELSALEAVSLDLGMYVTQQLQETGEEQNGAPTVLLSFVTDHPKTLLEIGKYPQPSSCQNYESTGTYNTALLGYVYDSHIKAACVAEVEGIEGVSQDDLNKGKVVLNEGKRRIHITLENGRQVETGFSRPKARRIVLLGGTKSSIPVLGRKLGRPYIVEEPVYVGRMKEKNATQLLEKSIAKMQDRLKQVGVPLLRTDEFIRGLEIGGSKNPQGHYNDLLKGARGQGGVAYRV